MLSIFLRFLNDSPRNVLQKIKYTYVFLIGFNILVWALALLTFHDYPALLGTCAISYTFGLRHAVDADHIAAIDNVTRKLMQEQKRPVTIGLFFSLGHSTIVIVMSVAIVLATSAIEHNFPSLKQTGGLIGTSVSALFLLAIGIINAFVLWDVYQAFRQVQRGGTYSEQSLDESLNQRGLIGRFFRPLLKLVSHSWNMYPIGVLFGLGFDTATEVGLLGIAANSATQGLPVWSIMLFPALFTAAMTLVDTTDGILMLGAYGWAFLKPIRKLYYNLTITLISVVVALVVGSIEVLGLIADQLKLTGFFWDWIGRLNDNFGIIGYLIIGIFIASWIASTIVYKIKKYDDIPVLSNKTSHPKERK
jgi:nickel/cobalt transporter (NiCoT) family protein